MGRQGRKRRKGGLRAMVWDISLGLERGHMVWKYQPWALSGGAWS